MQINTIFRIFKLFCEVFCLLSNSIQLVGRTWFTLPNVYFRVHALQIRSRVCAYIYIYTHIYFFFKKNQKINIFFIKSVAYRLDCIRVPLVANRDLRRIEKALSLCLSVGYIFFIFLSFYLTAKVTYNQDTLYTAGLSKLRPAGHIWFMNKFKPALKKTNNIWNAQNRYHAIRIILIIYYLLFI